MIQTARASQFLVSLLQINSLNISEEQWLMLLNKALLISERLS